MGRFDTIIHRFIQWGSKDGRVFAALIIGSQAREDHPADMFSDLDLIMVVDQADGFLQSDQWLEQIGNPQISFLENTVSGDKERRILFDDALDIDFVILTRESFETALENCGMDILKRGYRILIDKIGIGPMLSPAVVEKTPYIPLAEDEFINITNDFWYHAVWTAKKLIRGEVWTAKSCADSYMKRLLLILIEYHAHILNGMDYDTWHDGRFLEEWAEKWIIQKLQACYAHYESGDIKNALIATMDLFRLVSAEIADKMNYEYPEKAEKYSTAWVIKTLEESI